MARRGRRRRSMGSSMSVEGDPPARLHYQVAVSNHMFSDEVTAHQSLPFVSMLIVNSSEPWLPPFAANSLSLTSLDRN
jgi:hypothetical protein